MYIIKTNKEIKNYPKNNQIINKILTKCTKMTDEGGELNSSPSVKKSGINGAVLSITTTTTTTTAAITATTSSSPLSSTAPATTTIPSSSSSPATLTTTTTTNNANDLTNYHYNRNQINNIVQKQQLKINSINDNLNNIKQNESGSVVIAGGNKGGNGGGCSSLGATTTSGGRLQFFKDGKFILELARAREGEKTSWISVPRKTFWPPTISSTNVNFHKHESSTSLSFSDDNSSIQSSPWQRDHCWKQTTPRPNISKEMMLYYYRPNFIKFKLTNESLKSLKIKRRRPYDTTNTNINLNYEISNDQMCADDADDDGKLNGELGNKIDEQNGGDDCKPTPDENGEKEIKVKHAGKRKKELGTIVQKLTSKITANLLMSGGNIRNVLASSHQQHVSPRKRILREFEKVSLEDTTTMKRSRPKPSGSIATSPLSINNSTNNSSSNISNCNKITNGLAPSNETRTAPTTPVSRPISSYSITSLLGHNSSNDNHSNSNIKKEHIISTSHHHHHHPLHQFHNKDVDHLKTGLTSPKSPSDHMNHRYYGKKKSPNYSNSTASPSSASDYTNYNMIRSPDLSPSPEHQPHSFTRYRQHPYNMHQSAAVSSPNYSLSSAASRCSPSPNTNDSTSPYSGKYRSNYLSGGSPPTSSSAASFQVNNNNSPQHYSRQSPVLGYNNRKSPQSFNRSLALNESPTHHMNYNSNVRNNNNNNNNKESSSPSISPIVESSSTPTTSTTTTSTSIRTVPKKTAALRQQFGSPVSSPSSILSNENHRNKSKMDNNRNDYYRDRSNSNTSSAADIKPTKKDLDYSNNGSSSVLSGVDVLDAAHNPLIRPNTMIASPTPHHPTAQDGMFYMYPQHFAATLAAQQPNPSFAQPPLTSYYQHMYNQAAAAYRHPLWLHYPSHPHAHSGLPHPHQSAVTSSAHSNNNSRIPTSILNYSASGLASLPPPQSSGTPWGLIPPHHMPLDESNMVSIKDEPSSDVPLNLSKH